MARDVNKTKPTTVDPMDFIATVESPQRRSDAQRLVTLMRELTGEEPYMYGPSIIGFGTYHYIYESGREGDAPCAGFSPRKAQMVVYLMGGYEDLYPEQLAKLGPYKTGNSCLYFKKLDDLDLDILKEMILNSYHRIKEEYPD